MENKNNIPLGLGMALAQNEEALEGFSKLSKEKRDEIIAKAGKVKSKQEMAEIAAEIESNIEKNN